MKCSGAVRAATGTLGLTYVLAQGMLRDSPVASQVVSALTLITMMEPRCTHTTTSTVFLTVLIANLCARGIAAAVLPTNVERSAKIVRWDAAAAFLGIAFTTFHAWNVVLSSNRKKRTAFTYVLAALFVLPLLGALPYLMRGGPRDTALLRAAIDRSASVYRTYGIHDQDTDTRVNVSVDGDTVWIAFAGTDSAQNVKTDVNVADVHPVWSCGDPKLRVHRGFNTAYASVRDVVLESVTRANANRIIVTGHSLGGALAVLCAHDLGCRGTSGVRCITFGAPQVGDKLFAQSTNTSVQLTRVVTPYDPIPKSLSSQFVHAGSLVVLGSDELGAQAHSLDAYRNGLQASKLSSLFESLQPALFALVVIVFVMHKFTVQN